MSKEFYVKTKIILCEDDIGNFLDDNEDITIASTQKEIENKVRTNWSNIEDSLSYDYSYDLIEENKEIIIQNFIDCIVDKLNNECTLENFEHTKMLKNYFELAKKLEVNYYKAKKILLEQIEKMEY